jgi:hypothetical protein
MKLKNLFGALVAIILLANCRNSNSNPGNVTQDFLDSLNERQILNYKISIPRDYSIKEKEGPDFTVFYFAPTDTTIKHKFSGGIYFGNYPNKFSSSSGGCKNEIIKGDILDGYAYWTVFDCNGDFSIQTITASKSREGWNNQIHAFGHGKSKNEIYKLLGIYSTLRKK